MASFNDTVNQAVFSPSGTCQYLCPPLEFCYSCWFQDCYFVRHGDYVSHYKGTSHGLNV